MREHTNILVHSLLYKLLLLLLLLLLADPPALLGYFTGSETREYAPILRTPGDRCAGYYRRDPPGYSDPAPDRKTELPDTCPCTPIPWVFIFCLLSGRRRIEFFV
jgi:hypothetical protein